jgi:hypothetical protein
MVAEEPAGAVYGAHLVELRSLGVAESSDGQVVLALASAMDDRAGVVNLAATAKALVELMTKIRAVAPVKESELDRIRARRAQRAGGSTA